MVKVGIAADHGGFLLKVEVLELLRSHGHSITDFGAHSLQQNDDYPDFVVPPAGAIAAGEVDRGVAICGSGVGACIVANKVAGVRAALIHDIFSSHQGVEDENMNLVCLGGRVVGYSLAWELSQRFLEARFSWAERHRRRLIKVAALERKDSRNGN